MGETLGRRIERLRLRARLGQKELGRACGLSESAISNLEHGKVADVKLGVAVRMARALGVSVEELAGLPDALADREAATDRLLRELLARWRMRLTPEAIDRLREMREVEDPAVFAVAMDEVAAAMSANVSAITGVAAALRRYRGED